MISNEKLLTMSAKNTQRELRLIKRALNIQALYKLYNQTTNEL
jgi:hypothetical protein